MKFLNRTFGVLLIVSLSGCGLSSSSAIYQRPPPGAIKYGTGSVPVNPDEFRVDPKQYPKFHATEGFQPPPARLCWINGCFPLKQQVILKSDVWRVTHVVQGRWLIESSTYQAREEKYVRSHGGGSNQYDFAIYVTANGKVEGGWQLLPGSNKLFSERYTYLTYDPEKNAGWPSGQVFYSIAGSKPLSLRGLMVGNPVQVTDGDRLPWHLEVDSPVPDIGARCVYLQNESENSDKAGDACMR